MAARKNVRCTARQIQMLIDYMSTHARFVNGDYHGPLRKVGHHQEWVRIQQLLRKYGPNKTVEQWRTTWRDLKKKARADGARANAASAGNDTSVPSLSDSTIKILKIIGLESDYSMADQCETQLGKISVTPPPDTPPPLAEPDIISRPSTPPTSDTTLLPTIPSTSAITNTYTEQPSIPSTATQPTRSQRARRIINEFLASDADTRNLLIDISNRLKLRNHFMENKMRRNHLDRLHKLRMEKTKNMGFY